MTPIQRKTLVTLALNESIVEALTILAEEITNRQRGGDLVAEDQFQTIVRVAKFDGGRDTMARFIKELRVMAEYDKRP